MKPFLIGSAALLIAAGAANAADMPAKVMPMKVPPPLTYNWTGFYVGGYYGSVVGYAQGRTPALTTGDAELSDYGIMVGGTVGYNWQFDPHWLVGVEGDFGWMSLNRSFSNWNDFNAVGQKADGSATARLRFGYVTGPSLLYVTGGGAFVHLSDSMGDTTNSATKSGWTAGAGIETKLSRSWSAKTEYLYASVGESSFTAMVFGAPTATTFDHHQFHMIKTGLNYKIGEPFFDGLLPFGNSPMLPSDHNWKGFYAGLNAGLGISNVRAIGGGGTAANNTEEDLNGTGWAGGAHVGYNYFVHPKYFVGVEGDVGYLGVSAAPRDWNDAVFFSTKTDWYGTARLRVGTTTGPALLYVTGGGAWVHLTDAEQLIGATSTGSRTAGGWTFGGGTEVALGPRWSARIESLYMDVGSDNRAVGAAHAEFKDRFTVVRAGLSYAFGN